jgi:general secretion pathway protein G
VKPKLWYYIFNSKPPCLEEFYDVPIVTPEDYPREQGFTLIEIMIVVIIIGLLAALVAPRSFGKLTTAKQKLAEAQIELFGTALDVLRLNTGRYPTTEEGLKALREKPSGVESWSGRYLPKEAPVDSWGKPYLYKSPGDHGDYDLFSYGLDGTEGENQDVSSWKDMGR